MAQPKTWTREEIMNDPAYIGKDLVLPEDRAYLEDYMNKYYPNHYADKQNQDTYAYDLQDKQMEQRGYKKNPKYGYDGPNGEWTAGPSFNESEYWKSWQDFDKTRQTTLQNEINRKYPDWPEDYRNRVGSNVYSAWNDSVSAPAQPAAQPANSTKESFKKGGLVGVARDKVPDSFKNGGLVGAVRDKLPDSFKKGGLVGYAYDKFIKPKPEEQETTQNVVSGVQGVM